MTSSRRDLPERFRDHVRDRGFLDPGDRLVVAVSGGVDSVVLLHLFRFTRGLPRLALEGAHLDHRMREGSAGDARWLEGLCRAWGVPLHSRRLGSSPGCEEEARNARYAFLQEVRREVGARWVVTAHHGDDQAETVLFRVLRGTGIRGLRGIPESRSPGILRPLLPFAKEELRDYARRRGLRGRSDPTNLDPGYARNVIRHELLPRVEEAFAPGAPDALRRLARLARENEAGWESLYPQLLEGADIREEGGRISVARDRLLEYHPAVRARLIRKMARRLEIKLDAAGTHTTVEFTSSGASGRGVDLPDGGILSREFDRIVLRRRKPPPPEDRALRLSGPQEGEGRIRVGGKGFRVRWASEERPEASRVEGFLLADLGFPLLIRGWSPGDRIRFSYGSKKVKKVLGEERVPVPRRSRLPVLVDSGGDVLWIPGVARGDRAVPEAGEMILWIGIDHVDSS